MSWVSLVCCVLHRFWNFLNGLWHQSRTVKRVQKALRKLIIGHIHVNMHVLYQRQDDREHKVNTKLLGIRKEARSNTPATALARDRQK